MFNSNFSENDIVAIDGPSGAGKSSISKKIASKLGFKYLDTGAMYRATTLYMIEMSVDIENNDAVTKALENINISFDNNFNVYLNDNNITEKIRSSVVVSNVSKVSSLKAVRVSMVDIQRQIASNGGYVVDGRDIGSFVFPNARYKFYIDASIDERAKRRFEEEKANGNNISFDDVFESIKKRDFIDSTRSESPLVKAENALLVDTTSMSIDDVINFVVDNVLTKKNI